MPKVSFVVLNLDRLDALKATLESIEQQDYPDKEIIVVDNGSTDGSIEMVRRDFPGSRLLALGKNRGIAGRNEGIRAADGKYIFCLDNDITFLDRGVTHLSVAQMEKSAKVAVLSLFIAELQDPSEFTPTHWWHPRPREEWQFESFPTSHFNEAAVLFRKAALDQVGLYPEELFWACEEMDLGLRLLDAGWDMLYFPAGRVLHHHPRGSLNVKADPRHYLITRNRFWIVLKRYPLLMAARYIAPRVFLWAGRSLRYGYFGDFSRGLFNFLWMVPGILRSRKVVSSDTIRRLREIESSSRKRARKHRRTNKTAQSPKGIK